MLVWIGLWKRSRTPHTCVLCQRLSRYSRTSHRKFYEFSLIWNVLFWRRMTPPRILIDCVRHARNYISPRPPTPELSEALLRLVCIYHYKIGTTCFLMQSCKEKWNIYGQSRQCALLVWNNLWHLLWPFLIHYKQIDVYFSGSQSALGLNPDWENYIKRSGIQWKIEAVHPSYIENWTGRGKSFWH